MEPRAEPLDPALASELGESFRLLGDPTRVRILDLLSREPLCVGEIAERLGMTASAVSHQLRLLRSRYLVRRARQGKCVIYALDDDHVRTLFRDALEHVQERYRDP
ncbi:MAG: ArsR/SmtB family transcription factor [Chloroflexia bacterium]